MKIFILESSSINGFVHSSTFFQITFEDLKIIYEKKGLKNKTVSTSNNFLWRVKYQVENKKEYFEEYLKGLSDIVNDKIKELNEKTPFFYDKEKLMSDLLGQEELSDDHFPFLLYVSANSRSYGDIGLLVFRDKIEYFEGNEDSTPETSVLVSTLIGDGEKEVKIFGHHGISVVNYVRSNKALPAGLYVSPEKEHAITHWDMKEDRYLIIGHVKLKDLNRESDLDWKTNKPAAIRNLRII
jgi:hypothetical protein